MSLAKALGEYFVACKNNGWLVRAAYKPIEILPRNHVSKSTRDSSHHHQDRDHKLKQNDAQLVKENYEKIGKGSHFERHAVRSYLKPLGFESLKRSQSVELSAFKSKEASQLYRSEKNQSLYNEALNQQVIQDIIETLVKLTPKASSMHDISPININDSSMHYKSPFHKNSYSEIPPIPDFQDDPIKFEQYVYMLTHSTFHFKKSSSFNGIIPHILRNIFHPLNHNTLHLRTPNSFNFLIHYFSKKWNIAMCRELLVQMKFEKVRPTTSTYNIMIKSILTLRTIKHQTNPYKIVLKHLKQMEEQSIPADVVTWNLIFRILKDESNKSLLLNTRRELNIPLDKHSIQVIFRFLVEEKGMSAHSLLSLINSYNIAIDSKLMKIIAKRLVKEDQCDAVFKLIDYGRENFKISVSPDLMNLLLVKFAAMGRVDLVVATINKFKFKYSIRPDSDSHNLVMKSMANAGFWGDKYSVWRVLYHIMMHNTKNIVAGEYWIRRLRARMKFIHNYDVDLSKPLDARELEMQKFICSTTFDDLIPYSIKDQNKEYKKFAKLLGVFATKGPKIVGDAGLQDKKKMMKKYKRKISALSIQKAMVKRIPYADEPYAALKEELKERNLIE